MNERADTLSSATATLGESEIQDLAGRLSGRLIRPVDRDYDQARRVWNGMIDRRPALIARCRTTADVITCVNLARERGLLTAVRGGGHGAAGMAVCDGGLVIDLSEMRAVEVLSEKRIARAQGGATWAELDTATQAHGLATPGGAISTTGIAGLTLSGGIGWLRRKHGLSCDNLLSVELVTADGAVRTVSANELPDLFWALRGGGGNFGVATRLDYQLHPIGPEILNMLVMYPMEAAADILPAWAGFMQAAPEEFSGNAFFASVPPAPLFPKAVHGRPVFVLAGMWCGDIAIGLEAIAPLRRLAEPVLDGTQSMPYAVAQSALDGLFPAHVLQYYWKSLYLRDLSAAAIATLSDWATRRPSPLTIIDVWQMGGAAIRVPPEATAFGDRSAPYWLVINTTWADPAEATRNIAWARGLWEAMQPYSTGAVYLNFPGLGEEGEQLVRGSHGANYARLTQIKARYDPTNLFRLNQNILPAR